MNIYTTGFSGFTCTYRERKGREERERTRERARARERACGRMAALRSIQDQLHDSVRSYRSLQQEVSQLVTQQVKLQQQVNETKMVEQELAMLDETSEKGESAGGVVYKLVGPLLVRQDTYEAKANVAKRLEYIQKEMYVLTRVVAMKAFET